ncbi:hypothetical protein HYC85_009139 [Camellia sinensis]|uniref:Uncharacterized protein n=1 Tax=Camellia sinensis TaxID=4442 RepID=A0A7J7HF14_CAMSI|nr:hypothetical protein HYC85_009139 [Camellia sinensis]
MVSFVSSNFTKPLSKENSSSANGSTGASDGPEHIVSQSVDGEARNDGVLASSNERGTDCRLANNVDGSSSNLDIASSHWRGGNFFDL